MEEPRIKVRNTLLLSNLFLLLVIFTFVILHARQSIEINSFTMFMPIIVLLVEAVVFLSTFKYLKTNTRKIIIRIMLVIVIVSALLTSYVLIYEKVTGYIFIYRYTYGFLLISFLIYPTILLIMLLLVNKFDSIRSKNTIVTITSLLVVIVMVIHGLIGGLSQRPIDIVENQNESNTIYIVDSFLLHGTEYEYVQVNEYFMEYIGISREW